MVTEEINEQVELLLVDGSALLHRAYHAFPKMTTGDGRMVNAVYGFASIFIAAMEQINPEYVVVAWDVPKPTFRHKKYIGYKANRPKTDQDLIDQIPMVYKMLDAFGVSQLSEEGFEADDVIGSAADKYKGKVDKVVVLTGDQDTMQLVEEKIAVLTPGRGKNPPVLYGPSEVENRYAVTPAQIVDYKAMVGDSSDNIPGVAGIGPKTASQLLQRFGDLDGVYAKLGEVKAEFSERIMKLLEDNKESAYMSQELAQIKRDMEIEESIESFLYDGLEKDEVREFFTKANFKSLIKRVFGEEKEDDKQMGLF